MANIKQALGGTTAITITLTSVANYGARESTVVSNTTNLYLDSTLSAKIQMSAVPNGDIYCLLDVSQDNTTFAFPATGADAAITLVQYDKLSSEQQGQQHAGSNLIMMSPIRCGAGITTTGSVIWTSGSVAAALGGNLTPQWGPVILNCTGAALGATAGNHVVQYDGIYATSV